MTRFKELRRIERALKDSSPNELDWAKEYCAQRLSLSTLKDHKKHWSKLLRKVESKIEKIT